MLFVDVLVYCLGLVLCYWGVVMFFCYWGWFVWVDWGFIVGVYYIVFDFVKIMYNDKFI